MILYVHNCRAWFDKIEFQQTLFLRTQLMKISSHRRKNNDRLWTKKLKTSRTGKMQKIKKRHENVKIYGNNLSLMGEDTEIEDWINFALLCEKLLLLILNRRQLTNERVDDVFFLGKTHGQMRKKFVALFIITQSRHNSTFHVAESV